MRRYLLIVFCLITTFYGQYLYAAVPSLAPGYGNLDYVLPLPGSYELPSLGKAGNGKVLAANGESTTLHEVFDNKYVLLSFIYSSCSDINGCPLSSQVSYKIKSAMKRNLRLANRLKLVSLSFDPEYDTPEVMRLYGDNFKYAGNAGEWAFLTTDSREQLQPLLTAYKQEIQRNYSVAANSTRDYSHILRVFLIDPEKNIRNIYSVEFLHSDIVLNDFQTLVLQENPTLSNAVPASSIATKQSPGQVIGAGDFKQGYEDSSYTTRSSALKNRIGESGDLLQNILSPPLGLPAMPEEFLQRLSRAKIQLGRKLFFDRRMSLNNTISCAICHVPEQGFTSNEISTAIGFEGRSVRRNTPTILNVAYAKLLFHDGREDKLEQQVWGPLLSRNEMANPSIAYVVNKLKALSDYDGLFENSFNGEGPGMHTIGEALAAYQSTLLSADSHFDQWYFDGKADALNRKEKAGFKLFTGKARCSTCHTINTQSALLTDQLLHNTGIGYENALGGENAKQRITLAPGISVEVDKRVLDSVRQEKLSDVGLYEITQNPDDRWKYKTPTIRNISVTAPYMHDGSISTLREVIDFYNQGGIENELLDPLIQPLNLNTQEIEQLLAFLNTLTGSNLDILVLDAFAAHIGDTAHAEKQ